MRREVSSPRAGTMTRWLQVGQIISPLLRRKRGEEHRGQAWERSVAPSRSRFDMCRISASFVDVAVSAASVRANLDCYKCLWYIMCF